jgi:hypothetical protein
MVQKHYTSSGRLNSTTPVLNAESEHQYNRKLVLKTGSEHQYNRNGNTSQYCSISGENISTTGMVILVSTAPLVERTSVQQEW